ALQAVLINKTFQRKALQMQIFSAKAEDQKFFSVYLFQLVHPLLLLQSSLLLNAFIKSAPRFLCGGI
ncbi:MAG: hypothetical protein RLZZ390_483, partial [Bacteroidota bacterium]